MLTEAEAGLACAGDGTVAEGAGNGSTENGDTVTGVTTESIKIILYPPKNKKFKYDEDAECLAIQSVCRNGDNPATEEVTATGLTPAVEKCQIDDGPEPDRTDPRPSGQFTPGDVRQVSRIERVFSDSKLGRDCFLKGCKWSPDGLCLLTCGDDRAFRLFEVPGDIVANPKDDLDPVLTMKEGGTIYDYQWYPLMNSSDPVSCVFASASQGTPIHLWDAYTGNLRATYQPINHLDEVTPAYSLAFSPDGSKIYSGYKKVLRIFYTSQPGRVSEERWLKTKGQPIYQTNIVSTICINPVMQSLCAVGCYDKTIGVYDEPEGDLLFVLRGHTGGVTQVQFSPDGFHLFSGGRKDPEILGWDIRNPGKVFCVIRRLVDTQQKIQFDLTADGSHLVTGTTDGHLKLYNVTHSPNEANLLEPVKTWLGHRDCVNGVHFHPTTGARLLATASGQRHFGSVFENDDDDDDDDDGDTSDEPEPDVENSLKIWSFETAT